MIPSVLFFSVFLAKCGTVRLYLLHAPGVVQILLALFALAQPVYKRVPAILQVFDIIQLADLLKI